MTAILIRVIVESSIRSALVAAAVALILGAFRLRDASLRHGAWTAVLSAMLLMPALPYAVPAIGVPLPLTESLADDGLVDASPPGVDRDRRSEAPAVVRVRSEVEERTIASTAAPAEHESRRAAPWPLLVLSVYGAGVLLLSTRCWIGWRKATRIAYEARRADIGAEVRLLAGVSGITAIRESAAIVTPVTVGALAPVILLPAMWRQWRVEQVRAVVAHEIAHVRRRDPLVSLLAHINHCLFWFHPVAWWLERALAAAAEEASDDAAIRAIGARNTYAEILLDMAGVVRERGGRVAWCGVGMDGSGLLGRRIAHVLSAAPSFEPTARRKLAAAVCSAITIFLVVACRPRAASFQNASTAEIEQRDRRLGLDLERVLTGQFSAWRRPGGSALPPVHDLEATTRRNPEDLEALKSLLVSYWILPPSDLTKRRAPILWLIEHRPDADLTGSVEARLFADDLEASFRGDPDGYQRARTLWLSLANAPDVSSRVLGNAAAFFETADASLAEQLLLRARAADPAGPWTARLGRLYAAVLAGSDAPWPPNRSRRLSAPAPRTAFGLRIRKTLGESTDYELLTATGWFLARGMRGPQPFREFDPDYWAEWCFRRALQVKPAAVLAHTELLEIRSRQNWRRGEPLWSAPPARAYESVAALPEAERFELLPHLARTACQSIESMGRWEDDPLIRDRMELSRRDAKRYAEDALVLAPRYRNHPQYGTAIYLANMTLGTLALREGDRKNAVLFLRNASRAPTSEELAYSVGMVSSYQWHLAADLLKQGERSAVLEFLDRMAAISVADRFELRDAAAEIRQGRTPRLYSPSPRFLVNR
jgi:beta-lactamase regulating signal transducer with metallopeptidase domain